VRFMHDSGKNVWKNKIPLCGILQKVGAAFFLNK